MSDEKISGRGIAHDVEILALVCPLPGLKLMLELQEAQTMNVLSVLMCGDKGQAWCMSLGEKEMASLVIWNGYRALDEIICSLLPPSSLSGLLGSSSMNIYPGDATHSYSCIYVGSYILCGYLCEHVHEFRLRVVFASSFCRPPSSNINVSS